MKFALQLSSQQPLGTDQCRALDRQLEVLRVARETGWNAVFAGQHFLSGDVTHLQPLPYLARLAADAGDMQVGVGILLLALHNPVEVAENFAGLDVVAGGRLIFGVGLGYRRIEYDALGVPMAGNAKRFEANLDIVTRLWSGEAVDCELPWCRLDGARLALLPVQRPRPPVWMAANSDSAVRRAARLADTWFVNPHVTVAEVKRQLGLFRAERGREPDELPLMREACIAASDEEALALARPYLGPKYATYVEWGQSDVLPPSDTLRREWEDLRASRFLVGSPRTAAAQIRALRGLGVTELVLRVQWPGMPHRDALRTLELLAEHMLPRA